MLPDQLNKTDSCQSGGSEKDTDDHVWQKNILYTGGQQIPFEYLPSKISGGPILLVCPPDSAGTGSLYPEQFIKRNFNKLIQQYYQQGYGIVKTSLWGIGMDASTTGRKINGALPLFHTVARAALWMGHTTIGQWAGQIHTLTSYLKKRYRPSAFRIAAGKETAVAALAANALFHMADHLYLSHCPVSYVLDRRAGIDYFNMAIHLPGILPWGDIALIAAMNRKTVIEMVSPVSITGQYLTREQQVRFTSDYQHVCTACGTTNSLLFD